MEIPDLSIVHLADFHVESTAELEAVGSAGTLASYIRGYARSHHLLLAFTGDIAWSGKTEQYDLAFDYLRVLIRELRSDYTQIQVAVLPGNHDVDFGTTSLREKTLNGLLYDPPPSSDELEELCKAQFPFFSSVEGLEDQVLDWRDPNVATYILHTGRGEVQISALNTASCSRIKESPGELFVDTSSLPERTGDPSCYLVLMHHPLHWLHESVRKTCADWIGRAAEIVLMGHEHQFDQVEIYRRNLPSTQYVAALALHDPLASREGFQILNVDLVSRECQIMALERRGVEYVVQESYARRLATSVERAKALRPSDAFLRGLEHLNVGITHKSGRLVSHSSIFVYPDLRIQPGKGANSKVENTQFLDGALLADRILLDQRMLIVGEEYAGKTFLIRQLFKDFLAKGLYPVAIQAKKLKGTGIEGLVVEAVREEYETTDPAEYFAVAKKDRILLIEDIDLLPDAHKGLASLSAYAEQNFGAVVLSCRELMLLRDPLTGDGSEELWSMPTAVIAPLSHVKRSRLISRWVAHEGGTAQEIHTKELNLEHRLNELLAQRAVPALPMALTLILESMDSRDSVDESTGAFGYHYQRLILQALSNEQARRAREGLTTVTDDIALELLGRTAYKAYASGMAETELDALRRTAIETRDDLIIEFAVEAAVETLLGSGLLRKLSQDNISFQFKYVYQYSVAKLLALWLNNDDKASDVRQEIGKLTSNMHVPENAAILIFFTFLTRDSVTIKGVVDQARQTFADVEPCDFGESIDRLVTETRLPMVGPSANVRRNREDLNRARDRADGSQRRDLATLAEIRAESRETLQEIDKAFQCMQVLGQVLRAYPTRLSGEEKKQVAAECYNLGLRTLTKFIGAIENAEQLVKEYFRRITSGQVDVHDLAGFEQELERHVSQFVRMGALGIVKRVARAVGSVHLRPLYPQIKIPNGDRPVKLINRAIGLDLLDELKPNETAKLYSELRDEKCRVASTVIQMLVWEYLFLHPVPGSQRQSVLQRMDMVEHPGMLGNRHKGQRSLPRHGKT